MQALRSTTSEGAPFSLGISAGDPSTVDDDVALSLATDTLEVLVAGDCSG